MEEFIIQQNIRRFERLLSQAEDAERRRQILDLLTTERERLAALSAPGHPSAHPGEGGSTKGEGDSSRP